MILSCLALWAGLYKRVRDGGLSDTGRYVRVPRGDTCSKNNPIVYTIDDGSDHLVEFWYNIWCSRQPYILLDLE